MGHPNSNPQSWWSRWSPVILIAVAACAYFYISRPAAPPPGWGSDLNAALAQAKERQRPVIVAFHAPNCPPCSAMDRTVFADEQVQTALKGFIPVRVDAARQPSVAQKYDIPGTPTYVALSPDGSMAGQAVGYKSPAEFIDFLNQVSGPVNDVRPQSGTSPPTGQ